MLRTIFFDLDGTLTHPHEGITRCIQHAIRMDGLDPPKTNDLLRFVGPPLRDSFAVLLDTADHIRLDRAVAAYRDRYETTGIFENAICPGVPELLGALTSAGRQLSVVTAKPTVFARRVLSHFSLDQFFRGVYGPDLSRRDYSKTSLISEALAATGAPASSVAMVGDRGDDVVGAKANGVCAVAVSWGYGTPEEFEAAGPDITVESTTELRDFLGCA